jgi:hypothetical protein
MSDYEKLPIDLYLFDLKKKIRLGHFLTTNHCPAHFSRIYNLNKDLVYTNKYVYFSIQLLRTNVKRSISH